MIRCMTDLGNLKVLKGAHRLVLTLVTTKIVYDVIEPIFIVVVR